MKSCSSLLVGSIIGIITFFCSPGLVEANEILSENFSAPEINSSHWNVNVNPGGTVELLQNSILHLSSISGRYSPYVYLQGITIPNNDYDISVKFKLSGSYNYGGGILFSSILLQNATTAELKEGDSVFQIWPSPNGIGISSSVCSQDSLDCSDLQNSKIITSVAVDSWNTLEIHSDSSNVYRLYLNDNLIYTTKPSSQKISNIWLGNPVFLPNYTKRPDIFVDYFNISTIDASTTLPTIIIPGLGGSWDVGAILSGSDGENWQVPSFVKVYDGLENSFVNAGYVKGDNLFVFPYDWRKPLSVLAEKLKTFIDTIIPDGEKVNLVGHSMGGLVARTYAQNYGESKVNKVVTVGSPNMGTVKAYGIWEGATLWDDVWWGKVALDLTTHFGASSGETKVQTIQRLVPSIKDLLPTYDYLKQGDTLLPWVSLTQKNDYLDNLNQSASQINSLTTTIYSKDIQTDSFIKVIPHSPDDLDRWLDGKPTDNPFETTWGDGTVIESSAKGPFANTVQGIGWHGELVTKVENIQKIFEVLGLDPVKALSGVDDSRKKVFVAALRSPGTLEVCSNIEITKCNDQLGLYFPDFKLFILPDYNDEELVVRVKEDGQGEYKLHLGNIDETSEWTVVDGNLSGDDQIDLYHVTVDDGDLTAVLVDLIKPTFVSKTVFNGWYKTPQTSNFTYTDLNLKDDYQDPTCIVSTEGLNQTCMITPNVCDKAGNCNTDPQTSNGANIDKTSPSSTFSLPTLSNNWNGMVAGTATDSASGVAKVELIIKKPKGKQSTVVADGTSNWSFTISDLTDGAYTIKSLATDVAGNVQKKLTERQIVLDTTAPKAPKIIFASDLWQRVWVSWLPVTTASKYRVYYGSKKNELSNVREARNSFWISDLLSPGKYFVSVTAIDEAGNESAKSGVIQVSVNKWWRR